MFEQTGRPFSMRASCAVALWGALASGVAFGQTASTGSTATASPTSTVTQHAARKKRVQTRTVSPQASASARSQTASSSANDASARAQQRAEDAQVLARQEARSDKEARITNEQVREAQQRQDAQQREVRIQDAPGPAQTGVVPAAGTPVQPQSGDQRIQDQPSAVPGQNNSSPSTPPQ